jgi:dolichol-phosphate mannosyltransferase
MHRAHSEASLTASEPTAPGTALVTGASGFVGANLVRHLVAVGYTPHCLLRPDRDLWRLDPIMGQIHVHHGSITDRPKVRRIVKAIRPTWVFNCATYGAYPNQADYDRSFAVNVEGTLNLVRACLEVGARAVVCAGSSSEYGSKDHAPTEDEALDPRSAYAATKAASTLLARYWAIQRNAPVVILRLYSVYGPWEEPTRLIPTVVAQGMMGSWPPLADPRTARDFVYADDVASAMVVASRRASGLSPGSIFNIGSGRQTSLAAVARVARHSFELSGRPRWGTLGDRPWDTPIWVANTRHTSAVLGWKATTSFSRGLKMTADWLGAHPELWPRYGLTSPRTGMTDATSHGPDLPLDGATTRVPGADDDHGARPHNQSPT